MLSTVLERFEEARVECVLGYSRAVNDMAAIVALLIAAMEDVRSALRGLSAPRRDEVLLRVREGRLRVRVVEGHVSHAKIFLLSEGPDGDRCVLTGSANFSTSALLGDQHEVLIRFSDDRAWEHFEGQYLEVRDHASAEVPIASLAEDRLDPAQEVPPDAAPVLAPGRGAQVVQLAQPAESGDSVERGRRVEKLYDVVLPALPKETRGTGKATLKLDGTIRKRFSGLIRRQTRRLDPTHPTFSLDTASREATVCGSPWALDSAEDSVREDAASLVSFWDAYRTAFRGRVDKLQRDYFVFLCWMFFSPLMCTLRRRAALEGRDVIRPGGRRLACGRNSCPIRANAPSEPGSRASNAALRFRASVGAVPSVPMATVSGSRSTMAGVMKSLSSRLSTTLTRTLRRRASAAARASSAGSSLAQ